MDLFNIVTIIIHFINCQYKSDQKTLYPRDAWDTCLYKILKAEGERGMEYYADTWHISYEKSTTPLLYTFPNAYHPW